MALSPRAIGRFANPARAVLHMATQPIATPKASKVQISKSIGFIKGPTTPGLPALPQLKVHPNWFPEKIG